MIEKEKKMIEKDNGFWISTYMFVIAVLIVTAFSVGITLESQGQRKLEILKLQQTKSICECRETLTDGEK